jgi:hypothetical protein
MELSGTWCLRLTTDAKLKRQQAESVVGVPTMVLFLLTLTFIEPAPVPKESGTLLMMRLAMGKTQRRTA